MTPSEAFSVKRSLKTILVLALACLSTAAASQEPIKETDSRDGPFDVEFEKLVNETIAFWRTPGLSIAVVDGDDTWSVGYGMATIPSTPADASTLYCVGSTTKAFTAAAMSFLVDDNEKFPNVQWDTPISQIIRDDFVLQDTYATTHATIEDALSHRTGMPRHDFSYGGYYEGHYMTPKDMVRSLRYLPLTAEPRTKWQYCNMMYVTVSYVIETLTESFLGDVIRTHILEPLGMKSTYFSAATARKAPEHLAQGYYYMNGSYHEVPDMELSQASGAGFMVSNVLDFTKWIRAMINQAPPISKAGHAALKSTRTITTGNRKVSPYTGIEGYSLGWETSVYKGYEVFQHSGGMEAFGAEVVFIPDLRYGLVALGNIAGRSNFAEQRLIWHLVDEKLGIPKADRFNWDKENQKIQQEREVLFHNPKAILYPNIPSPPQPHSLPLSAYTGTYFHPAYHNMTITLPTPSSSTPSSSFPFPSCSDEKAQMLHIDRREQTWALYADLEHISGEFFLAHVDSLKAPGSIFRTVTPTEFRIGVDGRVLSFGARLEEMMGEEKIWFEKVE